MSVTEFMKRKKQCRKQKQNNFIEEKILEYLCFEYNWNLDTTNSHHLFIICQDMF